MSASELGHYSVPVLCLVTMWIFPPHSRDKSGPVYFHTECWAIWNDEVERYR
jgi:hypothetical protein